jgi:hypothetical protein
MIVFKEWPGGLEGRWNRRDRARDGSNFTEGPV